jgi:uncharacterized membrane protein (DUF485 family)
MATTARRLPRARGRHAPAGPETTLDIPPGFDWSAVEHSESFQELVARKRRFVIPATVFFLAWYLGFVILAGYAEDFMGSSIYEGFTVGYGLALTQFVMVWTLGWLYLRKADREWDPLRERVVREAVAMIERPGVVDETPEPRGRFVPEAGDRP